MQVLNRGAGVSTVHDTRTHAFTFFLPQHEEASPVAL
jgi:hypothetical protein